MAVGNDWGTTDEQEIEDHIVHQIDNPSFGFVNYIPFVGYDLVNESNIVFFEVSPNPVSNGIITLTLDETMPSEVMIYNLNGQIVKSQNIENKVNTIDLNTFESGLYFVEVRNAKKTMVRRLIIE